MTDFLKLAQEAYDASTTYIDANYRTDWDYSIRAFRNEHAQGSKYLSDEYKARSRIFSPKTRSIIRKNEAAAMQAAFSNHEIIDCEPGNPDDMMSVVSASALKEIMDYRLKKTIPTFEIYLGGVQDAQTTGVVCSYQYWEYENRNGKKIKDRPCIELRPIENLRFDAGCSWLDPVGTSPYWCDIIPMYVCDVKAMMNNKDEKTGSPKWKKLDDKTITQARPDIMDSTRKSRIGNKQDPIDQTGSIQSFDIVWVMRWFMKDKGEDWVYYTLGTEDILSSPKPLDEVYFHGVRPYVMGYAILETHKAFKSSMPTLVKPIQLESTDIRNQRLDNVKYVLNKRMYVARGRQVDVSALVRNVPGAVVLMNDPKTDVIESNHPDVTSSAFVEHDRLNAEFDDLAGNFSPSTKVANNAINDTLGGSKMAAAGAGLMTEYLIQTINVTWWEKVLRQVALLEQHYETDEIILGVCASKAKLFPRFGISRITDMMLMNEVTVNVDMAMGDPQQRFQKFVLATKTVAELSQMPIPGANINEIRKEIYANMGYKNGDRFFSSQQDPQLAKAMQVIQQLKGMLDGKHMELQAQAQETQLKLQSAEKIKAAELQLDHQRISGDQQLKEAELAMTREKISGELQLRHAEIMKPEAVDQVNPQREQAEVADIYAGIDLKVAQAEKARKDAQISEATAVVGIDKTKAEIGKTQADTKAVMQPVDEAETAKNDVKDELQKVQEGVQNMMQTSQERHDALSKRVDAGMANLAQIVSTKRKAKGLKLNKEGNKTKSISIQFDDGTTEDMAVQ